MMKQKLKTNSSMIRLDNINMLLALEEIEGACFVHLPSGKKDIRIKD